MRGLGRKSKVVAKITDLDIKCNRSHWGSPPTTEAVSLELQFPVIISKSGKSYVHTTSLGSEAALLETNS